MEVLDRIPFTIDVDALLRQVHVAPDDDDAEAVLALVAKARDVGRPRAAYDVCFVEERAGDRLRIGEHWFESRLLAHQLAQVERVFAQIVTCGPELDAALPSFSDPLEEFWWDVIKGKLHAAAARALAEHLRGTYHLGKTITMNPGAGDAVVWPIEQQVPLFALLPGVREALGVQLTDSFLMVPNKTTSGFLIPTEHDFRSCEVCHREACPNRSAPFNPELWAEIQHD